MLLPTCSSSFVTLWGFMCLWLSLGQISPFSPIQRNTCNRSPKMFSPQIHLLLSDYVKQVFVFEKSLGFTPLPLLCFQMKSWGRQIGLAITNTVPPNGLCLVRRRGGFCLPRLGMWTTFVLLLRELGSESKDTQAITLFFTVSENLGAERMWKDSKKEWSWPGEGTRTPLQAWSFSRVH